MSITKRRKPPARPRVERLHEEFRGFDSTVASSIDTESGVIRNVRCLGSVSANGRKYSDKALTSAARLYEEIEVMIDHRGPERRPEARSMREGVGVLRNCRVDRSNPSDPCVRADLHYYKAFPGIDLVLERIIRTPTKIGLSHDALGEMGSGKEPIVEEVHRVFSVDLVRDPATSTTLFEERQTMPAITLKESLAKAKTDKGAAKLLKLLEQNEFAPMAEEPMEEPEAGGMDAVAAGLRTMVMGVLDDDSIDTAGKIARIKAILATQDKLGEMGKPGKAEGETKSDEPVAEMDDEETKMESTVRQLKQMQLDAKRRDLLEAKGLRRSDLSDNQVKLFELQTNIKHAEILLETWAVQPRSTERPKPSMPTRLREEHSGPGDFDKLRAELKESRDKRLAARRR